MALLKTEHVEVISHTLRSYKHQTSELHRWLSQHLPST